MILKRLLIAILILGLGSACAIKMPAQQFDLAELVSDVERRAYVIKRFKARFLKIHHSPLFDRNLVTEGQLVFEKPNSFRIRLTGDVNVEIFSDGKLLTLIHDQQDRETYTLWGHRDSSLFADPLMVVLNRIGNGAFRTCSVETETLENDGTKIVIAPGPESYFERIERALIWFAGSSSLSKVRLNYRNGSWDEIVFRSWSMLGPNDPEILRLRQDLSTTASKDRPEPGKAS